MFHLSLGKNSTARPGGANPLMLEAQKTEGTDPRVRLPLIAVVGPTASGKTSLAVALAHELNGEVVNADSVQIYRYFDIGSGKASNAEQQGITHHMLSYVDPDEEMDASLFSAAALSAIADIHARGKTPIVCGGTFLWVRALLYGLAPAPPKDEAVRERHRQFVDSNGRSALHARLRQADPASAERLNPNDFVRVSRALEVHELTGKPLSTFQAAHGFKRPRFNHRLLGVHWTPEQLTERIRARVTQMLQSGWEQEVRSLIEQGYAKTRPMNAVGYRQVYAALAADTPPSREALVEEITRATRIFARRQRTWLRDEPVEWKPGLAPGYHGNGTLPK